MKKQTIKFTKVKDITKIFNGFTFKSTGNKVSTQYFVDELGYNIDDVIADIIIRDNMIVGWYDNE